MKTDVTSYMTAQSQQKGASDAPWEFQRGLNGIVQMRKQKENKKKGKRKEKNKGQTWSPNVKRVKDSAYRIRLVTFRAHSNPFRAYLVPVGASSPAKLLRSARFDKSLVLSVRNW